MTINHFYISNKITSINYNQFSNVVGGFYTAVSDNFEMPCRIQVSAYDGYRFWQGKYDPDIIENENKKNEALCFERSLTVFGRDVLSKDSFNQAVEIEVKIEPIDNKELNGTFFATAILKKISLGE